MKFAKLKSAVKSQVVTFNQVFVHRAVLANKEQESVYSDGGGVVGAPFAPSILVLWEEMSHSMAEQVECHCAEGPCAWYALSNVKVAVKSRVERYGTLNSVMGLQ